MRLIDADSLKELYEGFGEYEDNLVVPIKVVIQNIDDMPTAYDIDKVVEQLENASCYIEDGNGHAGHLVFTDDAIEIVKGGAK